MASSFTLASPTVTLVVSMLSLTVKVPAVTDVCSIVPASLVTVAVISAVPGASTIESGSSVKVYVASWIPLAVKSTDVSSSNVTVTVSPSLNT